MKTQVFATLSGPVVKIPVAIRDRKRTLRRFRSILGRSPVAIDSGSGFAVFAARDSLAAHLHHNRIRRFAA